MITNNEKILRVEICSRSQGEGWEVAKSEWQLSELYFADMPQTCLCTHFPIFQICVLKNGVNGKTANVGNCCVKKFMQLPSDLIFQAVKRVKADSAKSLNKEAIHFAHEKKWLNDWELNFYLDTFKKRKLSEKQESCRVKINDRILNKLRITAQNANKE